jgi:hypothetical protein
MAALLQQETAECATMKLTEWLLEPEGCDCDMCKAAEVAIQSQSEVKAAQAGGVGEQATHVGATATHDADEPKVYKEPKGTPRRNGYVNMAIGTCADKDVKEINAK